MSESPAATGSLLFGLADRLRERLVRGIDAAPGPDGFALHLSDGTTVGSVDTWRSHRARLAVEVRLADPARGLAASMLHAFAHPGTDAPHLVCDVALVGHRMVIGADLVPRVDPLLDPDWATRVWGPLVAQRDLYLSTPGVETTTEANPRLRWLCSPWLITTSQGFEHTDAAQRMLDPLIDRFAELAASIPAAAQPLQARDRLHLEALFAEATDPVWEVVADLVGPQSRDRLVSLMVHG